MTTMTDQLTPRDQLEYYQSLLENLLNDKKDCDLKDYYISKYREKVEDLMYHILMYGDSWD